MANVSQDQPPTGESKDQPEGQTGITDQTTTPESSEKVEVNGEQVSVEELKKGYLRQKDYTKKTQDLAEQRKTLEQRQVGDTSEGEDTPPAEDPQKQVSDVADLLMPEFRKRGVVTQDEMKLQTLLSINPELKDKEKVLRQLSNIPENKTKAYEDIVVEYNLMASDKLKKAKTSGTLKGEPSDMDDTPQPLTTATKEQYEDWRKQNIDEGRMA